MKKYLLGAAVLLLLSYTGGMPFVKKDTGQLIVVETLAVTKAAQGYHLYGADTNGAGESLEAALGNLKENAAGQLFMGQMKRIILCGENWGQEIFRETPEEIPLGAFVYQTQKPLDLVMEELETLEKQLNAREQQEGKIPTVAVLQNNVLRREA